MSCNKKCDGCKCKNADTKVRAPIKGRAHTDDQKLAIMQKITKIWMEFPELRLGQLLMNATNVNDIFYTEDDNLMEFVEAFANKYRNAQNK